MPSRQLPLTRTTSTRTLARSSGALAALALAGVAAAQSTGGSDLGLGARLGIRFGVALVVNLLLGGALVAFGPHYATTKVGEIREDPAAAFGWGLLFGVVVPIVLVVLAVTIIGLVVAIPGLLLLIPVGIVGNAVTVLAVGAALTGLRGEPGGTTALVGALALAVPGAIPVVGRLVVTLVGFFGLGVVGRGVYRSFRE